MLETLAIKNLALVDALQVDFEPGLNVITGETGTGKSMILGALNLILGERADKSLVRDPAEPCTVEAVFQTGHAAGLADRLREYGLEPDPDGRLIVKRLLAASGAGRQFVNNSPVTLQVLKALGERLVDLHGPHDHQSLLDPAFQLQVLDDFGRLGAERTACAERFARLRELRSRRQALDADPAEAEHQLDLIAFQVRELEAADLREEEEAAIAEEQAMLGNAQALLQGAEEAGQALTEHEESALNRLAAARQAFERLAKLAPPAADWKAEALALAGRIRDLSAAVASWAHSIEGDPGRLQWLDDRLAVYEKLKRKYNASVPGLLALLEKSRARLRDLQTRGEQRRALDAELDAEAKRLEAAGLALRRKRTPAAARLAKAVAAELRGLGFDKAGFDAALQPAEPQASGLDALEFLFTPNPGEPPRALRAIASSGEMSRVMLAVKTVLADHDRIPVLVFDEIDVNIGGHTARRVGEKLAAAACGRQVLCITHLPQVAAHGAVQFAVGKESVNGRTVSRIAKLDGEGRVEELARMLGGRDSTRVALEHARGLLAQAAAGRPPKRTPGRAAGA